MMKKLWQLSTVAGSAVGAYLLISIIIEWLR